MEDVGESEEIRNVKDLGRHLTSKEKKDTEEI